MKGEQSTKSRNWKIHTLLERSFRRPEDRTSMIELEVRQLRPDRRLRSTVYHILCPKSTACQRLPSCDPPMPMSCVDGGPVLCRTGQTERRISAEFVPSMPSRHWVYWGSKTDSGKCQGLSQGKSLFLYVFYLLQKKMQKSFQTPLHTPEDSAIMCGVLHGKGGRKSNQANQGEDDHEDESECRER